MQRCYTPNLSFSCKLLKERAKVPRLLEVFKRTCVKLTEYHARKETEGDTELGVSYLCLSLMEIPEAVSFLKKINTSVSYQ